jgi:TMEM175 potassium channel family protein
MDATSRSERARDLERFLTFLDAIVAIAITLLVLPLVDLVGDLEDGGSVRHLLEDNKAPIGAFFLSFLVIAQLWTAQHHVLTNVVAANENLSRLLMLWSLTIVVLPFLTSLVAGPGDAGDQATTKILYVGTMAVASFVLGLVSLVVSRHPELRDSEQVPDAPVAFVTSATFIVALLVMLLVPATSYWPLLLLVVSDNVVSLGRVVGRRTAG